MAEVVNIFDFDDYKKYVNTKIISMPRQGYGQYRKIAQFLNMSTVMISQIFKGDRDLGLEQGLKLGHFFNLNKMEREFLFILVQYARAGTFELQQFHKEKIDEIKEKSKKLVNIVDQDKKMTEEEKAKFYSNWYYSGVRLLSSIEGQNNISVMAERFNLPPELISEVIDFLVEHGLCLKEENKVVMGPSRIHLEAGSPYIRTRQMDWRFKGFEKMANKSEDDFFFTAPLSVSDEGAEEIRERINQLIKDAGKIVVAKKAETLRCFNIDFFGF